MDPDPFCASCQIPTINNKPRSETTLNPKTPFKWVFMDIMPDLSSKSLTKDTTFSNFLLTFNAYSKLPRLYIIENIAIEEFMDKLNIFKSDLEK